MSTGVIWVEMVALISTLHSLKPVWFHWKWQYIICTTIASNSDIVFDKYWILIELRPPKFGRTVLVISLDSSACGLKNGGGGCCVNWSPSNWTAAEACNRWSGSYPHDVCVRKRMRRQLLTNDRPTSGRKSLESNSILIRFKDTLDALFSIRKQWSERTWTTIYKYVRYI